MQVSPETLTTPIAELLTTYGVGGLVVYFIWKEIMPVYLKYRHKKNGTMERTSNNAKCKFECSFDEEAKKCLREMSQLMKEFKEYVYPDMKKIGDGMVEQIGSLSTKIDKLPKRRSG